MKQVNSLTVIPSPTSSLALSLDVNKKKSNFTKKSALVLLLRTSRKLKYEGSGVPLKCFLDSTSVTCGSSQPSGRASGADMALIIKKHKAHN